MADSDLMKVEVHELRYPLDLLEVFHLDLRVSKVERVGLNQSPQARFAGEHSLPQVNKIASEANILPAVFLQKLVKPIVYD